MSVLVGISSTEIFINIEKNVKTFLQFENLIFLFNLHRERIFDIMGTFSLTQFNLILSCYARCIHCNA